MKPVRILSLRGGGIRGLATAILLFELELRLGRPLWQVFDFIAGTSTGGLLALGLGLGMSPVALVNLYLDRGEIIFRRRLRSYFGLSRAKYDIAVLHNELSAAYKGAPLRECKVPVMIPITACEDNGARFVKSWKHGSVRCADAGAATAAAPTYFDPWEIATQGDFVGGAFRDGGMFANNPVACAASEVLDTGAFGRPQEVTVVDIACPGMPPSSFRGGGILQVLPNLADLFMDSGMDAHKTIARRRVANYIEVAPELGEASPAMDDVSDANLRALNVAGHRAARLYIPQLEEALA